MRDYSTGIRENAFEWMGTSVLLYPDNHPLRLGSTAWTETPSCNRESEVSTPFHHVHQHQGSSHGTSLLPHLSARPAPVDLDPKPVPTNLDSWSIPALGWLWEPQVLGRFPGTEGPGQTQCQVSYYRPRFLAHSMTRLDLMTPGP